MSVYPPVCLLHALLGLRISISVVLFLFQICYFGRHVFMGYLNNEEKTREAIDDEGWLHSADIGRLDEDGFLWLTGRIKGDPYKSMLPYVNIMHC